MPVHLASVVEGHGDVEAVPILLRRIAQATNPEIEVRAARPVRTPRGRLVKPGELERAVDLAVRTIDGCGGVFVLLDSDDDCPGTTGPDLLNRIIHHNNDQLQVSVVLANREFESWFVAAADSLAGHNGLRPDLEVPRNPENIRGAKEWLTDHMLGDRCYSPTVDQPAFAAIFDFQSGSNRAASLDKLQRDVARILGFLTS